jgi:hypothetical protein
VGQPGTVMVTARRQKYLRLVNKSPESLGMNDPVPVMLESRSQVTLFFRKKSALTFTTQGRMFRQNFSLIFFKSFSQQHNII